MRVAMYYSNSDVRLEDMAVPEIRAGEALMRVEASGICGSDVMEWYRVGRVPLVLGHEVAGVIVKTGAGVTSCREGDRVVAAHHVPCLECQYCKSGHATVCDTLRKTNFHPGGFSEFLRLPAINVDRGVFKLPDNVSFEEGTFAEPLACVLRGQRIAGVKPGSSVLVIGSGISGLLHIALAKAQGASKIIATDISQYRLAFAKKTGADITIDARENVSAIVMDALGGYGAEIVIITASALPAITQALKSVRRGGAVLFFSASEKDAMMPVPINDIFWRTEVTLTSSYAADPSEHTKALELISSSKVNVRNMITHRLPLAETEKGFRLVSGAGESVKVIVEPQR